VGPLSGKTLISVVVFAVSWLLLHLAFRGKDPAERMIYWATGLLVAGGILLTFPTFFDLFKPE
jgi:hypothetical protein